MDGLVEVPARQFPNEHRRRWFTSADLDLIVWLDDAQALVGFQLCYDKGRRQRALIWSVDTGFEHTAVDDGDVVVLRHKASPVLIPAGAVDIARLTEKFVESSAAVPAGIVELVIGCLRRYPA